MSFSLAEKSSPEKKNNLGNRAQTKQRQNTKHKQKVSKEPSRSPQKKKVELQPPSKAGPSLLFHRGRTACSLRFWVCGPAVQEGGVCRNSLTFSSGSSVLAFCRWRDSSPLAWIHARGQKAVGGGLSLLPYPLVRRTLLSGRFETRTSWLWFELLQLWVHPPLVVLQINTHIWRWFGIKRTGARVPSVIYWRNNHLSLGRLAAPLSHVLLDSCKFEICKQLVQGTDRSSHSTLGGHQDCIL